MSLPPSLYKVPIKRSWQFPKEYRIRIIKILTIAIVSIFIISHFITIKNQTEEDKSLNKISKYIILPEEKPVVATVKDINSLKENTFFNGAKEGDKLFIFEKSGKALLYNLESNRIINFGSVAETGIITK